MDNKLAKEIITKYVFSEYNMKSVYPFLDKSIINEKRKAYVC